MVIQLLFVLLLRWPLERRDDSRDFPTFFSSKIEYHRRKISLSNFEIKSSGFGFWVGVCQMEIMVVKEDVVLPSSGP